MTYTPKLPPPTEDQQASLAQLEASWAENDALEQAGEREHLRSRSLTVREAAKLQWAQPREALATLIEGLEHAAYGRGRQSLLKIAYQIATDAKYDRDRLKAAELLLAYSEGRPAQTILHADVTPQWLEQEIRRRHPDLSDDQVLSALQRLAERKVLPDADGAST